MRVWSEWSHEGMVWVELCGCGLSGVVRVTPCGLSGVVRVWSGWNCVDVVLVDL